MRLRPLPILGNREPVPLFGGDRRQLGEDTPLGGESAQPFEVEIVLDISEDIEWAERANAGPLQYR